jgi:DNA-binding CsgD family transcriptional regulator
MILSRAAELATLEQWLDDLRVGSGRALLIRGEPGIGKTTLLDALADRCGDEVAVLRARGLQTEAELAFSALADLVGPLVDDLGALPEPQAAALAAAVALGPPAPGDRLAICVATLGFLRAAARRQPVCVLVDDVQWLDASSRECVMYAARRAGGFVGVALAARDPWDSPDRLPELRVGPLPDDAANALLTRAAPDVAPSVAAALVDAAAGNPLALVELPAALTAEQRAGVAPLELPVAPGSRLGGAFAGRLAALDPLARRALLVAATHIGDDLATIAAACTAAGTDVAQLADAEARGLVHLDPASVRFAHPLIRGASYHGTRPTDRRYAHRALASVLAGEQRAWHRAAATVGPDEDVAVELEQVAGDAAARRAFASASAALERAARLSPEHDGAGRRLLAAGEAAGAAGAPDRALALLEEAASSVGDASFRARANHLRGRMLAWGNAGEATTLLVAEAEQAAERGDRVLAATMLADAANGCTNLNAYDRALEYAERAVALLGRGGEPEARAPVLATLGWVLVLRGMTARGSEALREAERLAGGLDPLGPHWPWLHLLLRARIPLGELERAHTESTTLCERAREAGALAALGGALLVAADVAYRLGDWPAADALTLEAIPVAGDNAQPAWKGFALTTRARLTAARGLEHESRDAIGAALEIAEADAITAGLAFVHGTIGFLELSLERVDAAIGELERVERLVEGSRWEEPTIVPWAPDLVEAHVRAGRAADARRVLAKLEHQAAMTGTAVAGAAAARCRGLLEDDFEAAFTEALALDDRRPMPFERARTLLAFGRRLHRARRRVEARERLREALAGFERLGAAAWATQAQNELRAAGARRRAARNGGLTPQEERVAAAVRRGASNREIAAELFLAPKTVEFHLHQIYRKLGARSRTQLVATLVRDDRRDADGAKDDRSGDREAAP